MTRDVLARVEGRIGRLTLNRPEALHALTLDMCRVMTDALLTWRHEPAVELVLLDHAGERGFCAGGDIRMLARSGAGDGKAAREFFFAEYRLNHLLFDYPKPTVAIMDGVTMGGGVGLAMPARYRVDTERTTFAMPETGIGLFPDVGGGWFLPRLPCRSGYWLGLTGARLKAPDCIHLGIANACVWSGAIERLVAMLKAPDVDIAFALRMLAEPPANGSVTSHLGEMSSAFSGSTIEEIDEKLLAMGSPWALAQRQIMSAKSPTSLQVALRLLQCGAAQSSFAANMATEYRIASRLVHHPDFQEGVRAVIVDKDNCPTWAGYARAKETELLDQIFEPLTADQEWSPIPEDVIT